MTKLLEKKIFILLVILSYVLLVLFTFLGLSKLGVLEEDIWLIVAGSLLALPITFLAIYIPISENLKMERKRSEKERVGIYLAAARYIGAEIDSNLIWLEENQKQIKNEISEGKDFQNTTEENKQYVKMGVYLGIAEDLVETLQDSTYLGMTSSGALLKISSEKFLDDLTEAYNQIKRLRVRSRHLSKFYSGILNRPPITVPELAESNKKFLEEKIPTSMEVFEKEIELALRLNKRALRAFNKVIKPLGKQYKLPS